MPCGNGRSAWLGGSLQAVKIKAAAVLSPFSPPSPITTCVQGPWPTERLASAALIDHAIDACWWKPNRAGMNSPAVAAAPLPRECGVYFACVPPDIAYNDLWQLFSLCGQVVDLNLYKPFSKARLSKGCGIVVYATPADAQTAIQRLHGSNLWPHAREPLLVQPRLPEHQKPPKKPKPPGASFMPPGMYQQQQVLLQMPQMQMGVYALPDGMQGLTVTSQPPYVTGMSVQQQYPGAYVGLQYPAAFMPNQVAYGGSGVAAVPMQQLQHQQQQQHQHQHQQQLVMASGMLGPQMQMQMSLAPVVGPVAVSHPAAGNLQGGPQQQQPQQQYQQQILLQPMQAPGGSGVMNVQMGGTMQPMPMAGMQMVPVAGATASPSAQATQAMGVSPPMGSYLEALPASAPVMVGGGASPQPSEHPQLQQQLLLYSNAAALGVAAALQGPQQALQQTLPMLAGLEAGTPASLAVPVQGTV